MTDKSAAEFLSRIDPGELPQWTGRPDPAVVLAYRYLRPGYRLAVEARRFEQAEVLQALIDSLSLSTVVADDGQMMTALTLSARNNGRQHLEIQLPPQAALWSAFVAGDPVRPSENQGRLFLPLGQNLGGDSPVTVELTYVERGRFPAHRGPLAFQSPAFDAPLKNAHWDLFLPPDYDYGQFAGSMTRAGETGAPAVQAYSLSQYKVQQQAQETRQRLELRSGLKDARESLTGGNLRQALSWLNNTRSQGLPFSPPAEEQRDLNAIADDLRRAAGNTLIVAQNNFTVGNSGTLANEPGLEARRASAPAANPAPTEAGRPSAQPAAPPASPTLSYDADVAGRQWEKLLQAQQVAAARIPPLRVNLPTRGVRFSFAQVLQTETLKPMTIRLTAKNTSVPSWTTRAALALLGFAALWALMALLPKARPSAHSRAD